jgi:hypothetical protein
VIALRLEKMARRAKLPQARSELAAVAIWRWIAWRPSPGARDLNTNLRARTGLQYARQRLYPAGGRVCRPPSVAFADRRRAPRRRSSFVVCVGRPQKTMACPTAC